MKKANRLSSLLLIFLIIAISGCSPATSASNSEPIHITMWSIAIEADATHDAFSNAVETYNANHSDVQIDVSYIESESFKTQLQVAIAAGETPDIFQDWGGGVLNTLVEAGVVREIQALGGEAGNVFRPAALGPSTFDGKHYSVPVDLAFALFFYNKDLFAQHNVQIPTTWDEFISVCHTFREAGIVPAAIGNIERWPGVFYMDYLVNRIGGQEAYVDATYNQANGGTYNNDTFIQAWQKISEAVEGGCFEDGINGSNSHDAGLMVATDQAAMQLQGNWMLFFYRDTDPEFANSSLGVFPFPAFEGGEGNPTDLLGGTGQAMAISATAPPETEAALIEMLGSEQFARDLAGAGLIPAAAGYDEIFSDDPIMLSILAMLSSANNLHLFYGTDLAPELANAYNNVTQQIYGQATTPEQAALDMQEAAEGLNEGN
ncbi:MAG: extracellular solute-binding protein [Anaerolineales bacterium]|nr:extracellular solute-binding protein [Anaerolineales bacterium]